MLCPHAVDEAFFIMAPAKLTTIEIDMQKLDEVLDRVQQEFVRGLRDSQGGGGRLRHHHRVAGQQEHQLRAFAKAALRATTEKTAAVLGEKQGSDPAARNRIVPLADGSQEAASSTTTSERAEKHPPQGTAATAPTLTPGAEKIVVSHESLQPGDPCPKCEKGTVYETGRPGVLVRLVGQAPIQAKVYELQKLRCNLCGVVFTAQSPEGVGTAKYDATAGSMIALLKYGSGMPFNREEKLQASVGVPLPASTQWEIVRDKAAKSNRPTRNWSVRRPRAKWCIMTTPR